MKAVASERRRFGYRRIHVMLQRQGIAMNIKKLRRLYSEERLQVRKRGGRKRALGTRRSMLVPDRPNQRWSLDFVSNALKYAGGGRILLAARRRGTQLRVQVSDTGPGIDAQHVSRIFEEFWRAPGAAEGAGSIGLGLSIVERISCLLETRVEVRSSLGRGSTFSLDLPAGDARQLLI